MNKSNCNGQSGVDPLGSILTIIFAYFYPLTLIVCIFGNCVNIAVYLNPFFSKSTSIRLLTAKAVANIIYMLGLLPNLIPAWLTHPRRTDLESFYYYSMPYALFLANTFGTAAAWLTVIVTFERYVCIKWPVIAKNSCKVPLAHYLIATTTVFCAILHNIYLTNRFVTLCYCPINNLSSCNTDLSTVEAANVGRSGELIVSNFVIKSKNNNFETVYHWLSSIIASLIPTSLLVLLTFGINYLLFRKTTMASSSSNTELKRSVNRLTMATTVCHLVLELPHVGVFAAFAALGHQSYTPVFLNFAAISNYMSMLNASIPVFIYLLCTPRFRKLTFRLLCGTLPSDESEHPEQSELIPRNTNYGVTQTTHISK